MQGVVIVFTTIEPFYTVGILKGDDGVFIGDIDANDLVLEELFFRRPAEGSAELSRSDLRYGIFLDGRLFLIDVLQGACRALLPVFRAEAKGQVILIFVYVGDFGDMVVEPFGIVTVTEGGKEIAGGREGIFCSKGLDLVLVAGLYIMQGKGKDGFIIKGIGEIDGVFPSIIFFSVGHIVFTENTGAELGIGAAAKAKALTFDGVEGGEAADGADVYLTCRFITGRKDSDIIHEPAIGFHFYQAVGIGIGFRFGGAERRESVVDPKAVPLLRCLRKRIDGRPFEEAIGKGCGLELIDADHAFADHARWSIGKRAKGGDDVGIGQVVVTGAVLFEILLKVELVDPVQVGAFAGAEDDAADGVFAVESNVHGAAEKEVFGVAGREVELDQLFAVVDDGVADEIHVEGGRNLGYGTNELHGKGVDGIVIDIDVFVQPIEYRADAAHVDVFAVVDAFVTEDQFTVFFGMFAVIDVRKDFLDVYGDEGTTGHNGGILVLEHKVVSFEQLVIDDKLWGPVQKQTGLFVLLPGVVVGGVRAIFRFMGDDLPDQLDGRIVFIPVFTPAVGGNDDVLEGEIGFGKQDDHGTVLVRNGDGQGLVAGGAEDEALGGGTDVDGEPALLVGKDAVAAVLDPDADICQGGMGYGILYHARDRPCLRRAGGIDQPGKKE